MTSVKVYSTPSCAICKSLKKFLGENNIKFEDINVASDTKAAQEMIEKSGQMSVPVTDIDGTIISGFNKEKVKKALNL
jgi:glutaredoxin-like YruB-family protein